MTMPTMVVMPKRIVMVPKTAVMIFNYIPGSPLLRPRELPVLEKA